MTEKVKPRTMTVPDAAWEYLGLGKQAAYRAAKEGFIPTIRVGKLLRVPVAAMEKMLADAGKEQAA
jgi:excisionase family DNA binding protein